MKTRLTLVLVLFLALMTSTRSASVSAQAGATVCDRNVALSAASGTTQTISAGIPGSNLFVCAIVVSGDTIATTVQFKTGSTNLTGAMRLCDECNIPIGNGTGIILQGDGSTAFTMTTATGAVTGFVRFGHN